MTATRLIDDCFLHDKERLRHDEALTLLHERLTGVAGTEGVGLNAAKGRIAASDTAASQPVPMHSNAAVDGYAFRHADVAEKPAANAMPIALRIAAGDLTPVTLPAGSAARIFTGAPMPAGADTVAMQEDCETTPEGVVVPKELKAGANCRKAGEDLAAGTVVVQRGTRLEAADVAALASVGIATVQVFKPLRVGLLSSGNELREPGSSAALKPGEVYDANRPLILSLLGDLPVAVTDLGIVADDAGLVRETLAAAAASHDVLITTGGASRGEEDHMLAALDALGKRHLWQLAVKPGRPMMFGQIPGQDSDCVFLGLPGNPVAAMVCFLLYARPAILTLGGASWSEPVGYPLPAAFDMNKKPDRREFLRGILIRDESGHLRAGKFARDGSGLISSLREADGLIEIPEDVTKVAEGDIVRFLPFDGFR